MTVENWRTKRERKRRKKNREAVKEVTTKLKKGAIFNEGQKDARGQKKDKKDAVEESEQIN